MKVIDYLIMFIDFEEKYDDLKSFDTEILQKKGFSVSNKFKFKGTMID